MRKPPTCELPTVPEDAPARTGFITQTRQYRLITPLFGGGVEPGQADPVTVVRATEVRGHLRFWWRATCGGTYGGDLAAMKAAEDTLWGAASNDGKGGPSQVEVMVTAWKQGTPDEPFQIVANRLGKPEDKPRPRSDAPPYAAFPLRPKREDLAFGMTMQSVQVNVSFTLKVSFPNNQCKEIEAALWAWETFGGIGARTRRGFGALQCQQIEEDNKTYEPQLPPSTGVEQWIKKQMKNHDIQAPNARTNSFPQIGPEMRVVILQSRTDAIQPWKFLINKLKEFRSTQNNSWPEPDAVRRLNGQKRKGRKNIPVPQGQNKFPRAAFGLPIIFHFADANDPADTTLEGVNYNRLASPLILRPIACQDQKYVGLAVLLHVPDLPGSLKLKDAPGDPEVEARLNGETDVLRAFLDSLR